MTLIAVEGYTYGNLSWLDFIPGHNYDINTVILLIFWTIFQVIIVWTAAMDLRLYIMMSYTANIVQMFLEGFISGKMDIPTILFGLIIYANAISYNLAHIEDERNKVTNLESLLILTFYM